MKAGLALDLVIEIHKLFKGLVYIKEIITDDDSTMRVHLKNTVNGRKLLDSIINSAHFSCQP